MTVAPFETTRVCWALGRANPITGNPVCLLLAGALLREARVQGVHVEALAWLMAARRERLTWHTLTQRKWQANTRRAGRASHHDSIAIREKYVRIGNH